jgi:DNA invertase Pin-like site-specific DNA recombinase
MRALGYTRLSRANENGVSLDAQRAAVTEACEPRGWELVEVVEDRARSGATMKRPGVLKAIDKLSNGDADVLVVARLDRLSRSVRDFANLLHEAEHRGWNVNALDMGIDTTTPQGEMMAHMFMAVAEFERKLIGQRTKEALAHVRKKGTQLGRPREVSDQAVKRVRELRGRGKKQRSLSEIARILNDEHLPTPRGGRWHPSSVKRVLSWDT